MNRDQNQFLGKKLLKLRSYFNLTQKECIEPLGLKCQQDYSDLELGNREFNAELISRISTFFKISIEDFVSLQNMEAFPFLLNYINNKANPIPGTRNEILEILILRKQLLEKDLKIIKLEQQLTKHQNSNEMLNKYTDSSGIYVLV